jgi:phosphoribosyl-AMP cyclohydrolase
MNDEALRRTVKERRVCFWSRSRQEYWVKGETSGNLFQLKTIKADCDADALLVRVVPQGQGVACHTGNYSCFFQDLAAMAEQADD